MELGEWIGGWIIENSDNRGLDNRGSTVHKLNSSSRGCFWVCLIVSYFVFMITPAVMNISLKICI